MIGDEKVRELLEAMKVTESITTVGFFIHNERVFDWRDLTTEQVPRLLGERFRSRSYQCSSSRKRSSW